jgi:hypothetical protein
MHKIKFLAEVYDKSGQTDTLEQNVSFKKMTDQGALLGSLLSSLQLRGFFDSANLGSPIKNSLPFPLLTYPFMDFFESHDISDFLLIEFGSGNSTLYFEKKFKKVISFETNTDWHQKIKLELKNTEYHLIEPLDLEEGNYEINLKNEKIFALIDAACNRYKITKNLLKKVKPNYIILDNAEWYRNTANLIVSEGYFEVPFWGYKNTEHWESCTTFFIRLKDIELLQNNNIMPPPLSRKFISTWDQA